MDKLFIGIDDNYYSFSSDDSSQAGMSYSQGTMDTHCK